MDVTNVPTELLLHIFDIGARGLLDQEEAAQGQFWRDSFSLPQLQPLMIYHLTLSWVCTTWRYALLAHKKAWCQIHLGQRAFLYPELTSDLLSRSGENSLHIDIFRRTTITFLHVTERYQQQLRDMTTMFSHHVPRIQTLRIAGLREDIISIQAGLLACLSESSQPSQLSHLHILQTNVDRQAIPLMFQAPPLTHLRVTRARVFVNSPLQELVVENGGLISCIFDRYSGSSAISVTNSFIVHDTTIHLSISGWTLTSLSLSDIKIATPLDNESSEATRRRWIQTYSVCFGGFRDGSLRKLKLSGLDSDAVRGLIAALQSGLQRGHPHCPSLVNLYLERASFSLSQVGVLAQAFTKISNLDIVNADGSDFLHLWRSGLASGEMVWSLLDEISLDGVEYFR